MFRSRLAPGAISELCRTERVSTLTEAKDATP